MFLWKKMKDIFGGIKNTFDTDNDYLTLLRH